MDRSERAAIGCIELITDRQRLGAAIVPGYWNWDGGGGIFVQPYPMDSADFASSTVIFHDILFIILVKRLAYKNFDNFPGFIFILYYNLNRIGPVKVVEGPCLLGALSHC